MPKVEDSVVIEDDELKGLCPKCGSELEVSSGKWGDIIQCKNYPKCRFTQSVKGDVDG